MRAVKSRNWSNKEDEDLGSIVLDNQKNMKKMSWKEIAELLNHKNPACKKNGKQCRQRWMNHVNPEVKKSEEWDKQQNDILFSYHHQIGNKWAEIATRLPGRTDNCIKNHFYSVMRGGLRKLNSYIRNVKRRSVLVKTFKNQILDKILSICQGKHNQKFQLSQKAYDLALNSKKNLILISLEQSEDDFFNNEIKQRLFNQICQFTRNCRRKKTKKINKQCLSSQNILQEEQQNNEQSSQQIGQKAKRTKNDPNQRRQSKSEKQEQVSQQRDQMKNQYQIYRNHRLQLNAEQPQPQPKDNRQQIQRTQKRQFTNQNITRSLLLSSISNNYLQKSNNSLFNIVRNSESMKYMGFQSSRTGFLQEVPIAITRFDSQTHKGSVDFDNPNARAVQQIQMLSNFPPHTNNVNFFCNTLFAQSPLPKEPIPTFPFGSISFCFSQFNQQTQQLFRKSLQDSQIIQGQQQQKNQQRSNK